MKKFFIFAAIAATFFAVGCSKEEPYYLDLVAHVKSFEVEADRITCTVEVTDLNGGVHENIVVSTGGGFGQEDLISMQEYLENPSGDWVGMESLSKKTEMEWLATPFQDIHFEVLTSFSFM